MSGPEITLEPHEYRNMDMPVLLADEPAPRPVHRHRARSSISAGQRAACAAVGTLLLWASVQMGCSMLVSGHLIGLFVIMGATFGGLGLLCLKTALWPDGFQTRV